MSELKIISSSNKFKDIIECLDHGRGMTREIIKLEKGKIEIEISFNFGFYYDRSNGILADEPILTKISKSNGKEISESEKTQIKSFIQENYK
jgi:hypothetical protein